jgi:hypothetical protein
MDPEPDNEHLLNYDLKEDYYSTNLLTGKYLSLADIQIEEYSAALLMNLEKGVLPQNNRC